jgi:hypothetical protein
MNPPAAWLAQQTAVHRFSARECGRYWANGGPSVPSPRSGRYSANGVDAFSARECGRYWANGGPSVLSPRMRAVAGSHGREPMVREPTHPPSRECGGSREQPSVGSYEIQSAEQCGLGRRPWRSGPFCSAMFVLGSLPRVTSRLRRFLTRGYTLSPSSRAFRGLFEGLCLTRIIHGVRGNIGFWSLR